MCYQLVSAQVLPANSLCSICLGHSILIPLPCVDVSDNVDGLSLSSGRNKLFNSISDFLKSIQNIPLLKKLNTISLFLRKVNTIFRTLSFSFFILPFLCLVLLTNFLFFCQLLLSTIDHINQEYVISNIILKASHFFTIFINGHDYSLH